MDFIPDTPAPSPASPDTPIETTRVPPAPAMPATTAGASALTPDTASHAQTYTVKSGDTLTKIAEQFGVTVVALRDANSFPNGRLMVAQQLTIPARASTSALTTRTASPPQNPDEAARRYRKAAEQGDARGQNRLGVCYSRGQGVAQDYAEAVNWYRKAADQGYAIAQCNLGNCYSGGRGVPQDYAEAVKWYRKAADQGYANAQGNLGTCYATGRGVSRDYTQAVKWFRKAAEQGAPRAQSSLGNLYRTGRGVPKDDAEAIRWYRKALDGGHEAATLGLAEVYLGQGNKPEAMKAVRQAIAFYEKQVQSSPDEASNYSGLSWANVLCGQAQEAEAQARKGLNAKAASARTAAYLKGNLGHALLCQGLTTQAIEQYREALRLGCEKDTFLDDFRLMKSALPEFKQRIEAAEKEVVLAQTSRAAMPTGPQAQPLRSSPPATPLLAAPARESDHAALARMRAADTPGTRTISVRSETGPPAPAADKVYRVPSYMSSTLNNEKLEIESERATVDALDTQVETLGREIDTDRVYLDRTSQDAVGEFNAKVGEYNALAQEAKTATATFNEKVDNYNAKLRQYGR